MPAISNLNHLLSAMQPVLHDTPYGYAVTQTPVPGSFATVAEDEGVTVIAPRPALLAALVDPGPDWARISLTVQSDLAAVGLTAAFARALADHAISANVVAGFHHDHIFVPWDRRHDALAALKALTDV